MLRFFQQNRVSFGRERSLSPLPPNSIDLLKRMGSYPSRADHPAPAPVASDRRPRRWFPRLRVRRPQERMRLTARPSIYLFSIVLAICGCASPPGARYVYQDGEFGVIGIPRNTFGEKADYRAQAELLMDHHFPEGYEIVRAEEVVEGQRILDVGNRTEIDAAPILKASDQMIAVGKLGRTTLHEEKDQLQIRECRIIYRRKSAGTTGRPSQFAAVASLTPQLYVNPNEAICHQAGMRMLAKAAPVAKHATEPDAEKVSSLSLE